MASKEYDKKPTFLDMEIQRAVTHLRNQQVLSEIDAAINWDPIENIVQENYPVGQSDFGNKAYPPLMLLKAILIQKWFEIKSDPDLECKINDRFSFKTFIGLPFSEPSPDHSIICRFRERTGKETLEKVHHELLNQFDTRGFSIESGMAVDARVVKSASRPVSDRKRRELREKRRSRLKDEKEDSEGDAVSEGPGFGLDGKKQQARLWYEGTCGHRCGKRTRIVHLCVESIGA
jgi:IS5 family transposase